MTSTKPRKMPATLNPKKTDSFAVGVTTQHYWVITALAEGRGSNRSRMLEEIIEFYINNKLSKAV
jgi:hypothetical protein